jgi:hypothetical protein
MDKNTFAGIYLVLLPLVAKVIELIYTRKDRRFSLGYDPLSLSLMGVLLTLGWLSVWIFGAYLMFKR